MKSDSEATAGPAGPHAALSTPTGSTHRPAHQGAERRYSARFLHSVDHRLRMTGLSAERAGDLSRRFFSMRRSELDREGRVVESILSSACPLEGLELYDFLAKLRSAVTPGGFRIEPNAERSWTITPPRREPFVLDPRGDARFEFDDGSSLVMDDAGRLWVGDNSLSHRVADFADHLGTHTPLISLSVAARAGREPPSALTRERLATLDAAMVRVAASCSRALIHLHSVPGDVGDGGAAPSRLVEYLQLLRPCRPSAQAFVAVVKGVAYLAVTVPERQAVLQATLDRCGKSVAPSRHSDPEAERAALLVAIGSKGQGLVSTDGALPLESITTLADQLRGAPRERVTEALAEHLHRRPRPGPSPSASGVDLELAEVESTRVKCSQCRESLNHFATDPGVRSFSSASVAFEAQLKGAAEELRGQLPARG